MCLFLFYKAFVNVLVSCILSDGLTNNFIISNISISNILSHMPPKLKLEQVSAILASGHFLSLNSLSKGRKRKELLKLSEAGGSIINYRAVIMYQVTGFVHKRNKKYLYLFNIWYGHFKVMLI